jgi:uncharacterized phage infection (PIP) family protein YhgE
MANGSRHDSPLVNSVLALQDHLAELERIGGKITSADMTAEVDVELIQKLLMRFAECGQRVSDEVKNLSLHLKQAQTRAETIAGSVSRQANAFSVRRNEQNEFLEKFRLLGEKVRALNVSLTSENGALSSNLPLVEQQLRSLIEELQELRNSARTSRIKTLEKSAESLAQSLQALRLKLTMLN